jgi:hypothetical protein
MKLLLALIASLQLVLAVEPATVTSSIIIKEPLRWNQTLKGRLYSMECSNYMISDFQGFTRFAVITADLAGPMLPEGAVVLWYVQLH